MANESADDIIYGPPRWMLILVATVIGSTAIITFIFARRMDTGHRIMGNPTIPASQGYIDSFNVLLNEPIIGNLIGRDVVLADMKVQSVPGDYVFWIGEDAENRVPVVLFGELTSRQKEDVVEIKPEQRLNIYGIVREMRDIQASTRAGFLGPEEQKALSEADIFISGFRVEIIK